MAKEKPRLVLDTNIIISAIISIEGLPAKILRACLKGQATMLVSDPVIQEYFEVLKYPKIQKYKKLDAHHIQELSSFFLTKTDRVEILEKIEKSADPDDDMFLETAVNGKATLLVSGDIPGLLVLKEIEGIPIVTAREAIERLNLNHEK